MQPDKTDTATKLLPFLSAISMMQYSSVAVIRWLKVEYTAFGLFLRLMLVLVLLPLLAALLIAIMNEGERGTQSPEGF